MHETTTVTASYGNAAVRADTAVDLRRSIEHASHYLPTQGPISIFVHHNTLHAFEELSFDEGVKAGGRLFGCHAYLPEEHYRDQLLRGRIRVADLEAVLLEDLDDECDRLIASFGTRYALRLAMLQFPLRTGPAAELRWLVAETDALRTFRKEVSPTTRREMIESARRWTLNFLRHSADGDQSPHAKIVDEVFEQFDSRKVEAWPETTWEAFVLNLLWRVCHSAAESVAGDDGDLSHSGSRRRHRDLLLEVTGDDSDLRVHETLIRFCSAFLDQGFSDWELPDRNSGFFHAFLNLHRKRFAAPTRWHTLLRRETERLHKSRIGPLESIDESLQLLGVSDGERDQFILDSLLALRGWAGMTWQMESNAEWAPHPAPEGSLTEFLAVRLLLDRIAIGELARESLAFDGPLERVREIAAARIVRDEDNGTEQRAFLIYQLAQVRGWKPEDLLQLSDVQWQKLITEIESFSSLERRRTYHLAFERKYRNETLDAVLAHAKRRSRCSRTTASQSGPAYQVACCIDEREESFRRHLEEFDPQCETFGIAGFFGVAMYYRGAGDAHFKPLCPVNIKPQHYVVEEPLYSLVQTERRRAETRRRIGSVTHHTHRGTRTFFGGVLTGLLGSVIVIPLVARVLFPRTTAQIRRLIGGIMRAPSTELRLERISESPNDKEEHRKVGYSVAEMTSIVEGGLRAMGLAKQELFSPLIIICGHGSSSLNNPHEAAHDCGACGGGRGGPNARAFAQMANDQRVRHLLADRGLNIPESTHFVGGYHNTCDDNMTWYELDRIPMLHRPLFERAREAIDEARKHSAHERCRRFESADIALSPDEALRHVEGRAEDLSQTRPEYGHATNALCFVGRREWSRGLFLDRRAFLTSYDPHQDDEQSSILERLLQAVIPVCAGINLEYYFSYVDPTGYGCGTKLPHNITSLLGVMDGAASDLRPGLPWQMVEIHEPVRILFVIETSIETMQRIIDDNEPIARLVKGGWVQLAVFDPAANRMLRYLHGQFVAYWPESEELPIAESSFHWYRGSRDHLGFASICHAESPGLVGATA